MKIFFLGLAFHAYAVDIFQLGKVKPEKPPKSNIAPEKMQPI